MTISRPWYKRFPDQFLAGTMDLTCEEKGAYSVLIDLTYARNRPIPEDYKWLSKMFGCYRPSHAKRLVEALVKRGHLVVETGSISLLKRVRNESEVDVRSNDFNGLRAVEKEEEYRRRGRAPKPPKGASATLLDFNISGGSNGRRRGPVSDEFIERLGAALDRHVKRG